MCAIIGSYNFETLLELVKLNSYRGSHSYSLSLLNTTTGILSIHKKGFGSPNMSNFYIPKNTYGIVHIQAPTTEEKTFDSIHPAIITTKYKQWPDCALWHNGIIKAEVIKDKSAHLRTTWDTMQILLTLKGTDNDWSKLSTFDGTFSCLMYDRERLSMYVFRNEISPLFIDKEMNISSTKFEGSEETCPNVVLRMDFNYNKLINVGSFTTVENPYYFAE